MLLARHIKILRHVPRWRLPSAQAKANGRYARADQGSDQSFEILQVEFRAVMMNRGGHNRKITTEQREYIIHLFLMEGIEPAQHMATALGLGPNYVRKLASERGYRPSQIIAGTLRTGTHP